MAVLARRDEITSDLTSLNPETTTKLRALFVQLYSVVGRSGGGHVRERRPGSPSSGSV